jgi:3-phenylpropionate/trans-cinnamate dioxygenase ferredoxin subunit
MPKIAVAKNGDVTPGSVRVVEAAGKRIALCNHDGTFYAIDDVCTHDRGPLDQGELIGWEIECPRHGARFDVRTGQATRLPAIIPVKTYPVSAEGDEISVEVPE